METQNNCPNCGQPLETNALQGLCPECLIKAGWPTVDQVEPIDEAGSFVPPDIDELAGLFPQLEILELIGRGGMGAVYTARQPNLDRVVALKILAQKAGSDPGFSERFTREARALAKLSHPSIVGVYDFGHAGDLSYFIMEYVDGPNLREIEQAGQLTPKEALEIIPQICEALQFAHDAGVVHRDIKPENILLDQAGHVKIADFGLAKIMGQERGNFTLTEPNHVMGTPHYMAPEQVEHPKDVDHRADIYSLGVVFYEMLTGELPLGKFSPPSRKVQMDVRLDEVVLRTLEKEPELRYQQVSQVRTEVQTIVSTPQTDGEEGSHLVKTSLCYISTPDHLRTFRGRFFNMYQGKGELSLSREMLSFKRGWQAVTVPLSAIKTLAQGTFPTTAKPLPLHYIAVTFEEHGVSRTLLFLPVTTAAMSPSEANKIGAQWLSDLIEAIRVHTGRTLAVGHLDVTQETSWWEYVKLYLYFTVISIIGFSVIPIILKHRLPNSLYELLPGIIFAIPMFFMCLTMPRWLGWFRDRANRRQSLAENGLKPESKTSGSDFGKMLKRLAVFILIIMLLLAVSLLVPELQQRYMSARLHFGPVVERKFYEPDANGPKIIFWDLDRDVIMSPRFPVAMPEGTQLFKWLSPASLQADDNLRQWIDDMGIDLALTFSRKDPNSWSWYVMGVGAERLNARFEERAFDSFKPADLIERKTSALRVAGNQIRPGRQSAVCFETDRANVGVLEYDGLFNGVTDGFKIRYKLLERRAKLQGDLVQDEVLESTASELSFRIVPKNAENQGPLTVEEEATLRRALREQGPSSEDAGTGYVWIRFPGEVMPATSVTETYQGQVYVLASNRPGEVMLPDGSWGLADTGLTTNREEQPIVSIQFDGPGADMFYDLTGHTGQSLGVIVDDVMVTMPTIQTRIRNQAVVNGRFTRQEANVLADALRAGMPSVSPGSAAGVTPDTRPSAQSKPKPPVKTSNMPAEAQKVYQVFKALYAAGMLNDGETFKQYLTPDQSAASSLKWIRRLNAALSTNADKEPVPRAIHWDDREALFISDKLELDDPRIPEPQVLLCLLTKKWENTWRIEDFDLEGVTELQLEISRFTQNHPDAQVWVGERHEPHATTDAPSASAIDFNDASFWQTQIARHLEGVRTLDCDLMTNRLVYGTDANIPESQTRRQYRLKWDRDHKWIDCAVTSAEQNVLGNRIIQGDQYGWFRHSKDWTRHKAGAGGVAMSQFSHFGQMRNHPFEHAFSVAKGILCSDTIRMTKAQGVINWSQIELAHSLDGQGRHVLKHALPMPGPDGQTVTAALVLIGTWEKEAFKLLELRGQIVDLGLDDPGEAYYEHVLVDGCWVPQRAVMYDWLAPDEATPQRLQGKTVVTVQRMAVNRPMTAEMFDGFEPPVGVRVDDQITKTHYRVWPDLEQIVASGGKDRVSVSGRVYLDGKPSVGTTVSTHVYDDPNEHIAHTVTATSNEMGEFVLNDLVPGLEYMVQGKDQAGHTVSQPAQLSDLGEDYTGLKLDMTSGLTVTGTVTDPNGQPLAKARVKFSGKSVVMTDEQGRYTIHGLYADKGYQVEAVAWGYAPLDPAGRASQANFKMVLGDEGELEPFDIVLQKEKILSGRLVDQEAQPVSGVRVRVWGSPFGIGDLWQWYDTRTDQDGQFSVGNLGGRIYGLFVGQYGSVYHSPLESPLLFQVTGDSFMPTILTGRSLVPPDIVARVETFEQPYRQFFRLKEYRDASMKNNGGKLISQWLEQLNTSERARQYELLAHLGSVPAYHAHDYFEQILCGRTVKSSRGAVASFGSNMASQYDPGDMPSDLIKCTDPNIVMLTMRALGRTGFTAEHAHLLIDKLDDENQGIRQCAVLALAELTGVYLGADKAPWETWLSHYQKYRSELNGKGYFELFAGLCEIFRTHGPSPETTERVMAAWQGGSDGGARFRHMMAGEQVEALHDFFSAIKIDGEHPVTYGHCPGYWPTDMFGDKGHRNQNLKIQFDRKCHLGEQDFEPGKDYTLPALFRDGHHGQWEIVDLRLDDIEEVQKSK